MTVLDPWNGSGTTTRILEIGHQAVAVRPQPVANLVASATIVHPDDAAHVTGLQRLAEAKLRIADEDLVDVPSMARSAVVHASWARLRGVARRALRRPG
ncbi:MAG: hypothetical protein IPK71_17045 [Myxococcales bacterium]|nr:hypothetical protein [Myxococcales bacterium]